MDAAPLTSQRLNELAELRYRAYGPGADIDDDAEALARLIELEGLARADAPAVGEAGAEGAASVIEPVPSTAAAVDGTETMDAGLPATGPPPRRRRMPVAALIALAALIGLAVGLAMPVLTSPRPIATLSPAPFIDGAELDFRMYGIPAESPVRYEPFRNVEVWSGRTQQGSMCVVVTTPAGEWMASGCAPSPLTATADIVFAPGMREVQGLDLADGSVLRFLLRGDAMEVWIAETDATA